MRALLVVVLLALLALPGSTVLAHPGQPPAPHDLWGLWNWEPGLLAGVGLAAGIYLRGVTRLWRSAGAGRGISRRQALSFFAGLAALAAALITPLDALAGVLLSAHMLQHLLLLLAAPPLLLLGSPLLAFTWALPRSTRLRLGGWQHRQPRITSALRLLSAPAAAWALHAAALLSWHLPLLYQVALQNEAAHALEHACFLGTALLFWRPLVETGKSGGIRSGLGVFYLFTTLLYSGVLAALLTFSRQLWYPAYATSTAAWGLAPLEDQQLAGALMWAPGSLVYTLTILLLMWRWLEAMDGKRGRQVKQREGGI